MYLTKVGIWNFLLLVFWSTSTTHLYIHVYKYEHTWFIYIISTQYYTKSEIWQELCSPGQLSPNGYKISKFRTNYNQSNHTIIYMCNSVMLIVCVTYVYCNAGPIVCVISLSYISTCINLCSSYAHVHHEDTQHPIVQNCRMFHTHDQADIYWCMPCYIQCQSIIIIVSQFQ